MMDQLSLFPDEGYDFPEDLVDFHKEYLSHEEADYLLGMLMEKTPWQQTSQMMYNKTVLTPRLTAWYGDHKTYKLGDKSINANPWLPELSELKDRIEKQFGYRFNSVLLNLYRDNNDSVAWHRDRESELGNRPVIASLSLGQLRNFDFRNILDHSKKYSIPLSHGSLLFMKGKLQEEWEHRIAKSTRPMKPRINLTFRLII